MIITILVFLTILSVLVLIHELGHFLVAKRLGIKVEEFGFGFPPRMFGFKKGETIYSVNWLPIGGFVKLYGEDEAGGGRLRINDKGLMIKDMGRAFFARSPMQKAAVIVAGVLMNAVLASVIFYAFLIMSGFKTELPLLSNHKFFLVNQQNKYDVLVSNIAKNSPAEKAGIKPLAKIVSVNGLDIKDTKNFIEIVNKNKGKEIEITWMDLKTNSSKKGTLVPRLSPPKNEGALGVVLISVSTAVLNYETPIQKIFSGVVHPMNLMAYNLEVMINLVKVSLKEKTTKPLSQGLAGPVGIASLTGSILEIQNLKEKIIGLLNLAGILSISLAFFNILPIPALDGGRLFFVIIEMVSGRKVNQKFESLTHTTGMVILLGLMALITFKDVQKLFSGFFKMP